jgi:hypothetical protein
MRALLLLGLSFTSPAPVEEVPPTQATVVLVLYEDVPVRCHIEDGVLVLGVAPPTCAEARTMSRYFNSGQDALRYLNEHQLPADALVGLFELRRLWITLDEDRKEVPQPPTVETKRTWRAGP